MSWRRGLHSVVMMWQSQARQSLCMLLPSSSEASMAAKHGHIRLMQERTKALRPSGKLWKALGGLLRA